MASYLSCVGLPVADDTALDLLVAAVRPLATPLGSADGIEVVRWQDESSGARLVLGIQEGRVIDLLPSLAARSETHLARVRAVNDDVVTAVFDDDGEQVVRVFLGLEQRRLLGDHVLDNAVAAIVAFGLAVSVHADADAFAASSESFVDPNTSPSSEPSPHWLESGFEWPPRMASESFFSYGVLGDPAVARADARFNGVVVTSECRTTALTGQSFIVARVRTAGFETDVCLDVDEHAIAPGAGQIISGSVCLVGSIPSLETPPGWKQRWWRKNA
jgi:hypothetical protein